MFLEKYTSIHTYKGLSASVRVHKDLEDIIYELDIENILTYFIYNRLSPVLCSQAVFLHFHKLC